VSTHSVLVVAATAGELAAPAGWRTLVCGVGPVEAASTTARALALDPPAAILHVGIAGARTLPPLTCVIGTASHYVDLTVSESFAPHALTPSMPLVDALREALPNAIGCPIGTSARVGGTSDHAVEAMEGFAVLRAAQHAGIPAAEVRIISNAIDEPDRTKWHIRDACAEVISLTPRLVDIIAACVR
jgi:nucleoside phosphorylase